MMIPKNIRSEHILKAIEEVERIGFPDNRNSKNFHLEYNGKYYPPKYILSLANKYANGKELVSSEFSGGKESNDFLGKLGFNIIEDQFIAKTIPKPLTIKDKAFSQKPIHDERCPLCKKTIKTILERIYGKVEAGYRFEIGTHPEDFRNTPYFGVLEEIYESLKNHRGFKELVRVENLPKCDFLVHNATFIVEFDESQHFTLPRRISLERYPEDLELGFDRKR